MSSHEVAIHHTWERRVLNLIRFNTVGKFHIIGIVILLKPVRLELQRKMGGTLIDVYLGEHLLLRMHSRMSLRAVISLDGRNEKRILLTKKHGNCDKVDGLV